MGSESTIFAQFKSLIKQEKRKESWLDSLRFFDAVQVL
jgi:hypothetical protein